MAIVCRHSQKNPADQLLVSCPLHKPGIPRVLAVRGPADLEGWMNPCFASSALNVCGPDPSAESAATALYSRYLFPVVKRKFLHQDCGQGIVDRDQYSEWVDVELGLWRHPIDKRLWPSPSSTVVFAAQTPFGVGGWGLFVTHNISFDADISVSQAATSSALLTQRRTLIFPI